MRLLSWTKSCEYPTTGVCVCVGPLNTSVDAFVRVELQTDG